MTYPWWMFLVLQPSFLCSDAHISSQGPCCPLLLTVWALHGPTPNTEVEGMTTVYRVCHQNGALALSPKLEEVWVEEVADNPFAPIMDPGNKTSM